MLSAYLGDRLGMSTVFQPRRRRNDPVLAAKPWNRHRCPRYRSLRGGGASCNKSKERYPSQGLRDEWTRGSIKNIEFAHQQDQVVLNSYGTRDASAASAREHREHCCIIYAGIGNQLLPHIKNMWHSFYLIFSHYFLTTLPKPFFVFFFYLVWLVILLECRFYGAFL